MTMRSALHACTVAHRRFFPKTHAFAHRVFLLEIDLDEWDSLGRKLRWLSVDAPGLYSLRNTDFLPTDEPVHRQNQEPDGPPAGTDLKTRARARFEAAGLEVPADARITLVAMPRTAGHLFNPAAFYFLSKADGAPLAAMVEVTNTFREVKLYVLGPDCLARDASGEICFRRRVLKNFYVSPFSPPDGEFDFLLHPPGKKLRLKIDHYEGGERSLTAPVSGIRHELTDARLALETLICPLVTLKVIGLIHLHAGLLWLKRARWWAKSDLGGNQTDLRRPSGLN